MPRSGNQVKFVSCTSQAYAGITPDANTIYFLTDTSDIYVGTVLYTPNVISAPPGDPAPDNEIEWCSLSGETLSFYQLGYDS